MVGRRGVGGQPTYDVTPWSPAMVKALGIPLPVIAHIHKYIVFMYVYYICMFITIYVCI